MFNKKIAACAVAAALAVSGTAVAHGYKTFNFKPIDGSANAADWDQTAPWKLPKGFTQRVVSDETDLNIYPDGRDDWHDMNVVNETGKMAGRFMYRTHEVRLGNGDDVVDADFEEVDDKKDDDNEKNDACFSSSSPAFAWCCSPR